MDFHISRTMDLVDRDPEDQTTFNFDDLPIRIIDQIFEYLETYEIVIMRGVLPSFKDYVDGMRKKKSSIRPFEIDIQHNRFSLGHYNLSPSFQTRQYSSPQWNHLLYYNIYGDVQLNWIRPCTVIYGASSNIFQTCTNFQHFFRNVWKFSVSGITRSNKKCIENFCKNMEYIENLEEFELFDKTVTEEELLKILSTIKKSSSSSSSQSFDLTLHQNLPCLKKSIIDKFFEISHGKTAGLYIRGEILNGSSRFEKSEKKWRDGIFRFFDYEYDVEEVGDIKKILEFVNCEKSTGKAIISALSRKFKNQTTISNTSMCDFFSFGNRTVQCKYIY